MHLLIIRGLVDAQSDVRMVVARRLLSGRGR